MHYKKSEGPSVSVAMQRLYRHLKDTQCKGFWSSRAARCQADDIRSSSPCESAGASRNNENSKTRLTPNTAQHSFCDESEEKAGPAVRPRPLLALIMTHHRT